MSSGFYNSSKGTSTPSFTTPKSASLQTPAPVGADVAGLIEGEDKAQTLRILAVSQGRPDELVAEVLNLNIEGGREDHPLGPGDLPEKHTSVPLDIGVLLVPEEDLALWYVETPRRAVS